MWKSNRSKENDPTMKKEHDKVLILQSLLNRKYIKFENRLDIKKNSKLLLKISEENYLFLFNMVIIHKIQGLRQDSEAATNNNHTDGTKIDIFP